MKALIDAILSWQPSPLNPLQSHLLLWGFCGLLVLITRYVLYPILCFVFCAGGLIEDMLRDKEGN